MSAYQLRYRSTIEPTKVVTLDLTSRRPVGPFEECITVSGLRLQIDRERRVLLTGRGWNRNVDKLPDEPRCAQPIMPPRECGFSAEVICE